MWTVPPVGLRRVKTGIMLLHGEDEELLKRIRAHGNFTEYVPLALFGLAGMELVGAPGWLVLATGTALVAGRAVHYATLRGSVNGLAPRPRLFTVFASSISLRSMPST